MTKTSRVGLAALTSTTALAALAAVPAGAQTAPCTQPPSNVPAGTATFNYSNNPQYFTVPLGVTGLRAVAEGAHGGQESSTAPGGAAGGVEAYIKVNAGDCITVRTGQFTIGSGGGGYSKGGSHGTTPGDADGNSGAAGGGSTAILRGSTPLLVAGGGGGGGGDGAGTDGGPGGSGGAKAGNGKGGGESQGGSGGCGGCQKTGNGQSGEGEDDVDFDAGAGGGGGGGFTKGGEGGDKGQFNGGGGGGGAGASYADPSDRPILSLPLIFTSGRDCPLRQVLPTCHGAAQLLWDRSTASSVIAPATPSVRILSTSLDRVLDKGLPVSHSTSGGPLKLELHLRGDGSKQPADFTTVDSGPTRDRVVLEPSERAKRLLADEDLVELRLRSQHDDGVDTQKLLLR